MLHFSVCNFTSDSDSLFSDDTCPPEIYLVSGHSTCHVSDLPTTVSAKKLAEIHHQGYGQTLVDLSWYQVRNSCILILRKKSCDRCYIFVNIVVICFIGKITYTRKLYFLHFYLNTGNCQYTICSTHI